MTTSFGRDTSCTTSLRTGRMATGARLVAESCFRRLTTPRGMLRGGEDEANFGLDLTDLVGGVTTRSDVEALPGRIKAELSKDERIESVDVFVTDTSEGVLKSYAVRIEAITGAGPFTLAVGVDDVTASLLGIEEGTT
jgi:hypothetical protein